MNAVLLRGGRYLILTRFHLSDEWRVLPETGRGVSYEDVEEILTYYKKFDKHIHEFHVVELPPKDIGR